MPVFTCTFILLMTLKRFPSTHFKFTALIVIYNLGDNEVSSVSIKLVYIQSQWIMFILYFQVYGLITFPSGLCRVYWAGGITLQLYWIHIACIFNLFVQLILCSFILSFSKSFTYGQAYLYSFTFSNTKSCLWIMYM